jgi:signal transduction histidine kinase/CheY-like chemotaxis protein
VILLLGTFVLWTNNRLSQSHELENRLRTVSAEQLFYVQEMALLSSQLGHHPQVDSLWNKLLNTQEIWSENQVALVEIVVDINSTTHPQIVNPQLFKKAENLTNKINLPVRQLFLEFDKESFGHNIDEIQLQTRAYTNLIRLLTQALQTKLTAQTRHWTIVIQCQTAALIIFAMLGIALLYVEATRSSFGDKRAISQTTVSGKQNQEVRLKHSLNIQKTINDNLRNAKKSVEQLSRAKGKFLSMLSHEIRNPVNAILGISHLLLHEPHSEQQAENLHSLHFSAEHLRKLLDNILDLGKIEADRVELVKAPFDLVQLSREVLNSYRSSVDEKGVVLKLEIDSKIPNQVVGDSLRISQILNNIISNSVKFTLQGEIRICLNLIQQDLESLLIGFQIIDTGVGVAEDKLSSIFDEFTQAQLGNAHKFGGTGLGLSITKRLVELHGGEISVKSKLNQGTTFSFELRLAKLEIEKKLEDKHDTTEDAQQNLSGLRVLAAEDDRINKEVLQRFLRKWKATFDIVDNGSLAVQLVENKSYDVILMDLNMPVLDGKAAVKIIREKDLTVPIVALTGSSDENLIQELLEGGFSNVATKPFIPQEFYLLLSSYFSTTKEV